MEQVGNKWREELGKKIRKRIFSYVKDMVKEKGDQTEDGFVLNINSELHTIVPLNISCYSSKRAVVFISQLKIDKRNVLRFYDMQGKWFDAYTICIDSLLLFLDHLEAID